MKSYQNARLALDMALSRGGDQAVVKSHQSYEFFGGSKRGGGERTKVRSRVMAGALSELVTCASQVLVMGHNTRIWRPSARPAP
jgi:c-di-AMP phosphodiesterase-like protein